MGGRLQLSYPTVQLSNSDLGTQSYPRYLSPHHGASVSQSHPKEHHGTPEGDNLLPVLCLALTAGHGDLQPLTLQHQLHPKQKHPTLCPGSVPLRSQQQGQGLPVAQTLVLQKLLCRRKGEENLKDTDIPLFWGLWSQFGSGMSHKAEQTPGAQHIPGARRSSGSSLSHSVPISPSAQCRGTSTSPAAAAQPSSPMGQHKGEQQSPPPPCPQHPHCCFWGYIPACEPLCSLFRSQHFAAPCFTQTLCSHSSPGCLHPPTLICLFA